MAQVISSRNNSAFSTFYTWLVLLLFFYTSFSSLPEGIMVFELLQCSSVRRGVANFPCSISQRFSRHLLFPMFSTMLVSISFSIYQVKKVKKKCSKTFFLLPPPPRNLFLLCIQHPESFKSAFFMKNYNLLCFYLYVE